MAASVRFLSGVYSHHGLADSPSMNRTAAMKTSSTHGSWRTPVSRHRLLVHRVGVFSRQVLWRRHADQPQVFRDRGADVGDLVQIGNFGSWFGFHGKNRGGRDFFFRRRLFKTQYSVAFSGIVSRSRERFFVLFSFLFRAVILRCCFISRRDYRDVIPATFVHAHSRRPVAARQVEPKKGREPPTACQKVNRAPF